MEDKIQEIIYQALRNLADELESKDLASPNPQTQIYGLEGILDSLALVSLITDIEEMVEEQFNQNITLADEKAMSLKNSPFKDVASLTAYVKTLLS